MNDERKQPTPENDKAFNDTLKNMLNAPPKQHKDSKKEKDKD
jgi:hypothetical protein